MPPVIGAILSSRMATIVELQTVLGADDVYDIIEVLSVDAHNRKVMRENEEN